MIGVAASRFIKASAERRRPSGDGQTNGRTVCLSVETPAYGGFADVETAEAAPAQHFGHAEGAV